MVLQTQRVGTVPMAECTIPTGVLGVSIMRLVNFIPSFVSYAVIQPMLEYIDRKGYMGAESASKAVQMHTVLNRQQIVFPNAHEQKQTMEDTTSGPLRLGNFLTTYRAKQMKQRNTKTGLNML